jgi:hypothetical protein
MMKKSELKEMLSIVRGKLAAEKNCVAALLGDANKLRCEFEKTKRALETEVKQLRYKLREAQEWTRIVEKNCCQVIKNEKTTAKVLREDLRELKTRLKEARDWQRVAAGDYCRAISNESAAAACLRKDLKELKAGLVLSQDAHNVTKNILRDTKIMLDSVIEAKKRVVREKKVLSWPIITTSDDSVVTAADGDVVFANYPSVPPVAVPPKKGFVQNILRSWRSK